jgi:hypothetical protein
MLPSRPDRSDDPGDSSRNPYAPPGSPAGAQQGVHGPRVAPYRRVAAISLVLGAGFGGFLGIAQTLQFGTGLGRFGGFEYVPRVVVLTTVRALGAGAAMLVTSVSATIVLHQLGRRAPGARVARDRGALWLVASTVATFVVVCGFSVLGGALTSEGMFATSVRSFLDEGLRTLTLRDVEHGAALATVDAIILAVLVPLAAPWLAAPRRGLILKLFVAYAAVQATAIVEQTLLALIER